MVTEVYLTKLPSDECHENLTDDKSTLIQVMARFSRNLILRIIFWRDVLYCNGPLHTFRRCKNGLWIASLCSSDLFRESYAYITSVRRTSNLAMYRVYVVDAIWRHWSRSTLAQVMACCLTAQYMCRIVENKTEHLDSTKHAVITNF